MSTKRSKSVKMWCVVGHSKSLRSVVCQMGFKRLVDARKWGKAHNVDGSTERIKIVGKDYVILRRYCLN